MNNFQDFVKSVHQITANRAQAIYESQVALPRLLSADATFAALKEAVDKLSNSTPQDHDVFIQAFGISVTQVRYIEPHTFLFEGFSSEGHATFAACHFSQLVAHIVYVPRRGPNRIITGFSQTHTANKSSISGH